MKFISLPLIVAFFSAGIVSISTVGESQAQDEPETIEIVIESVANDLKFDLTEISVMSGESVHLVFKNMATVAGMSHNVVILRDEESIQRVGVAAISSADTDYIPDDDAVLFFTPLAAPGETVEVTFEAPEPGTYYFVCTYLGHYVLMKGVFIVS
jgi:azurin